MMFLWSHIRKRAKISRVSEQKQLKIFHFFWNENDSLLGLTSSTAWWASSAWLECCSTKSPKQRKHFFGQKVGFDCRGNSSDFSPQSRHSNWRPTGFESSSIFQFSQNSKKKKIFCFNASRLMLPFGQCDQTGHFPISVNEWYIKLLLTIG